MLNMLKRAGHYKLNAGALDDLGRSRVPAEIVRSLTPLQDIDFGSRQEIAAAISQTTPAAQRYESDIVGAARVLRARRLWRYVASTWALNVASSSLTLPVRSYVALRPLAFTLRFRLRWLRFALQRRVAAGGGIHEQSNTNAAGFEHNRKQVLSFQEGHRNRTERIINVLRSIEGVDFSQAKVLCVGPRNEAEVLLLDLYGLPMRNVVAIDLFTYSPAIRLMDMNALDFPDDRFEIYYSSAVIKYSPDIHRTVAEAIRVTRDGGLMVFGFMFAPASGPDDLIPAGSELSGGLRELLGLFAGHVDHVYWQDEFLYAPSEVRASVIFRLKKKMSSSIGVSI
jgi:hypothetical protein